MPFFSMNSAQMLKSLGTFTKSIYRRLEWNEMESPKESKIRNKPSCWMLLKCSPRSQANTRCFKMPLDWSWLRAGRVLKKDMRRVISLPCFSRTTNKSTFSLCFRRFSIWTSVRSLTWRALIGFGRLCGSARVLALFDYLHALGGKEADLYEI